MIERDRLLRLHERILAGDVTATSDLFLLVHQALTRTVRSRSHGRLDWDDAGDLATDAILAYAAAPARFDPAQAGLFGWLTLIAHRDAMNRLRSYRSEERKRQRVVELGVEGGKDFGQQANDRMDADRILRDHAGDVVQDDGDEQVLRLFLAGERETEAYATELGIAHLPRTEQQQVVKQRRDRIEQRLRRLKGVLK